MKCAQTPPNTFKHHRNTPEKKGNRRGDIDGSGGGLLDEKERRFILAYPRNGLKFTKVVCLEAGVYF